MKPVCGLDSAHRVMVIDPSSKHMHRRNPMWLSTCFYCTGLQGAGRERVSGEARPGLSVSRTLLQASCDTKPSELKDILLKPRGPLPSMGHLLIHHLPVVSCVVPAPRFHGGTAWNRFPHCAHSETPLGPEQ
jgi:hypothetical protein